MIAYLKGILAGRSNDRCIIEVGGIGYEVEVSTQTSGNLPKQGSECKLLIYHHITENDQRLFGFAESREKELFEKLITVKGIGPKLGLTILSGMPAALLMEAIVTQNTSTLSSISGIGKKTAERMVLELKDKLFESVESTTSAGGAERQDRREESVSALEALGFSKRDSVQAVNQIISKNPEITVSEIVKQALSSLKR